MWHHGSTTNFGVICLWLSGMSHRGSYGCVTQNEHVEAANEGRVLSMCCTMLSGTVKDPRFIVPKDCDFMILDGGEQQPQHFLGEGFAVTMSTAAKNTLTVDWRFVMRDVGGNRDVFFVQNDYHMEATSLDAVDVQERYLALQAELVRYGVMPISPPQRAVGMLPHSKHATLEQF